MSTHAAKIAAANPYTRDLVAWRARWLKTARPAQLPPPGDWRFWQLLAGRGFGKTRIGAEDTAYYAAKHPGVRCAVVAPTQDDVRSVCFEGKSGIINVIPHSLLKGGTLQSGYNSSKLEIKLRNGSLIVGKSAEKPDRLRGPQWHRAWCDEVATWGARTKNSKGGGADRLKETWDNLLFGLRLGTDPKVVLTTTPRPIKFVRDMVADKRCHTTKGSMFDNAANLAPSALETLKQIYEGTRLGQQELYGEVLADAEGALWSWALIEKCREDADLEVEFVRIVVAVDPAVTSEDDSDETGIVVAGIDVDGRVWVIEDLSGKYKPHEWALVVLRAFERHEADMVVGETNQGGDLVEMNLRSVAGKQPFAFKKIHAKRGKMLRAEPIAAYYERDKVRHLGRFPKLEQQMTEFVGATSGDSPDRLDALVYAVGELMTGTMAHAFW